MRVMNYYKVIAGGILRTSSTTPGIALTLPDGSKKNMYCGMKSGYFGTILYYPSSSHSTGFEDAGILLGTGDTPVTLDDYTLSGDIITGLSLVSASDLEHTIGEQSCSGTRVYTFRNDTESDITIREVAMIGYCMRSVSAPMYIMVDREVLTEPVTIAPGNTGQVKYTFTVPLKP